MLITGGSVVMGSSRPHPATVRGHLEQTEQRATTKSLAFSHELGFPRNSRRATSRICTLQVAVSLGRPGISFSVHNALQSSAESDVWASAPSLLVVRDFAFRASSSWPDFRREVDVDAVSAAAVPLLASEVVVVVVVVVVVTGIVLASVALVEACVLSLCHVVLVLAKILASWVLSPTVVVVLGSSVLGPVGGLTTVSGTVSGRGGVIITPSTLNVPAPIEAFSAACEVLCPSVVVTCFEVVEG